MFKGGFCVLGSASIDCCIPTRSKPGPKGPSRVVIDAIVAMKERNPRFGCPRIAQQMNLAFGLGLDKDVVRRILAIHYRPEQGTTGPMAHHARSHER